MLICGKIVENDTEKNDFFYIYFAEKSSTLIRPLFTEEQQIIMKHRE